MNAYIGRENYRYLLPYNYNLWIILGALVWEHTWNFWKNDTYEHQLEKFKKLQTKVRFPLLPKQWKSVISAVDITLQLLKITLFINNNYTTQLTLKRRIQGHEIIISEVWTFLWENSFSDEFYFLPYRKFPFEFPTLPIFS